MEKYNADLLIRNFYMYIKWETWETRHIRLYVTGSIYKGDFVYLIELFPRLK